MEETRLLRGLRAVRRYAARPVAEDALRDILETARWTGSAKNTQPWELVVVRDRATLDQLATLGQYAGHLAGAPLGLALVLAGPGAAFDEGRLAQTLMLAAWAHGVGSCIASLYPEANQQRARDLLGVPAGRTLRTVIALGYPADAAATRLSASPPGVRAAVPVGRKPLEELVSWERYGRHQP